MALVRPVMTVAIMEIVAISPLQTLAELKPSQKPARLSIRKSLTINKDLLLKDALNRASLGEGIKDMAEAVSAISTFAEIRQLSFFHYISNNYLVVTSRDARQDPP